MNSLTANNRLSQQLVVSVAVSGAAGRCAAVLFWFIGAESCRHLLW